MIRRFASVLWLDTHPWDTLWPFPGVRVSSPDELQDGDILILHGGQDISPSLYKQKRNKLTAAEDTPSERDALEWALLLRAKEMKLPIIGICRGAQMLCAAAGGTLVQHVNGHSGSHNIRTNNREVLRVNSIHHQMMNPANTHHVVLATAFPSKSDVYVGENTFITMKEEPELVYFHELKGLGIQWHPEMLSKNDKATGYLFTKMSEIFKNVY